MLEKYYYLNQKLLSKGLTIVCLVLGSGFMSCSGEKKDLESGEPIEVPSEVLSHILPIDYSSYYDAVRHGYLLDSAIEGVYFKRSDEVDGYTEIDGKFEYYLGNTIDFYIGGIALGQVTIDKDDLSFIVITSVKPVDPIKGSIITPLRLTPDAVNPDERAVVNKLIFLQTLDDDGIATNGIKITEALDEHLLYTSIEFDVAASDFRNNFQSILDSLNSENMFPVNSPRKMVSTMDALRHFDTLILNNAYQELGFNTFAFGDFSKPRKEYSLWWQEPPECGSELSKAMLVITGANAEFCPNTNGFDFCYSGYVESSGNVLLPDIYANTACKFYYGYDKCLGYELKPLEAEINITNGLITGTFQASCNESVDKPIQTLDASLFIPSTLYKAYQSEILNELTLQTEGGSCSAYSDCSILSLNGDRFFGECRGKSKSLPFSKIEIAYEELSFKRALYNDVTDEAYPLVSTPGTTWCAQTSHSPNKACVNGICVLDE